MYLFPALFIIYYLLIHTSISFSGGLAGTAIGSYLIQEEFLTVGKIIKDKMNDAQRKKLAEVVKNILNIYPIPGALSVILSNDNLRRTIITAIVSHVQNIGYSPKY